MKNTVYLGETKTVDGLLVAVIPSGFVVVLTAMPLSPGDPLLGCGDGGTVGLGVGSFVNGARVGLGIADFVIGSGLVGLGVGSFVTSARVGSGVGDSVTG